MIVDLSHVLRTGIQIYPGDPEVEIKEALNVEKDFVNVLAVNMGSQSGTHVDSPFHVFADGKILKSGDASLAQELEKRGYDWVLEEVKQ